MGGKHSVRKVTDHKTDNQKPKSAGDLPDVLQSSKAIFMSDALVQRLARSNDTVERVNVYNVGTSPTKHSSAQSLSEKTLSISQPSRPPPLGNYIEDWSEHDRSPRAAYTPVRTSSATSSTPSFKTNSLFSHDPVRRQIETEIEEDLRTKAELTSSIRDKLHRQEDAYWETNSCLLNARSILTACYAAHPNNPIECAAAVKLFADTVNNAFHLVHTPLSNKHSL